MTGKKNVTEKTAPLGGSFTYMTLGAPTNLDKILTGESLPSYETIGGWLFHTATGEPLSATSIKADEWYLGESSAYHVWLIYKPDLTFLKSRDSALTLEVAETISKARKDKKHLVFAPAKFVPNKMLLPLGVEHVTLPFGLFRIEKS
jgi:adenine-specific DNA-methyltransferase